MHTVKRFSQIALIVLIDLLSYYTTLFLAWAVRNSIFPLFFDNLTLNFTFPYYVSLWWIPIIYISFIANAGIYNSRLPFWDEIKRLITSLTIVVLVIMSVVTLGQLSDRVSRIILTLLWTFSIPVFSLFRFLGKKFLSHLGLYKEKVLILGAGKSGRLIYKWLNRESHIGYEVIGYLDDDPEKIGRFINGKKVFGKIKNYTRFINELQINTIIIAMPSLAPGKISSMAFDIQQRVKNTMIVPDIYGIASLNTDLLHLFYEELFLLKIKNNLKSTVNRMLKRTFDFLISIIILPFLLLLTIIFGILIKIESRGPIIYSHERIGKNGRLFKCYKFRTMVKDAEDMLAMMLANDSNMKNEWERFWKLKNDPRITKTGGFLRKTSLDELPQIFNILKGEMSLIGPRPYLVRELKAIKDDEIEIITTAPPGITGLWQVSGRSNTPYDDRIRLDRWYIMNWSLWLDMFILFKTIKVVFFMKGVR